MPNLGFLKSGWGSWSSRFANPLARNMATVAVGVGILVGLYGGLSDNSTFARGALGGATLGALGGWLSPTARAGYQAFRGAGSFGKGFSAAARGMGEQLRWDGRASASYIGATARRGYNGFRGIFAK